MCFSFPICLYVAINSHCAYVCRIPKILNIFQISAPLRLIIIHEPIDVLWSPLFALNEILEVNPRKRVQSSKLCHVSWQLRLPNYAVQYWRSVWLATAWTVQKGNILSLHDVNARMYLQHHYGNGVFGNVYLSAGQH